MSDKLSLDALKLKAAELEITYDDDATEEDLAELIKQSEDDSELDALKEQADALGITYKGTIGAKALQAKIDGHKPEAPKAQTNPNDPSAGAAKRQELEKLAGDIGGGEFKKSLPDNIDKLKTMLCDTEQYKHKAEAELKELRHKVDATNGMVQENQKLTKLLERELKATESNFKPVKGYRMDDLEMDVFASPIGAGTKPRHAMLVTTVKGEVVNVTVTPERIAINDDTNGHWLIK